jgi:hypothetical protein
MRNLGPKNRPKGNYDIPRPDFQSIKKIVEFHYGFLPDDDEIVSIDEGLRNQYSVLHEQCIIRELLTRKVSSILVAHRQEKPDIESLFLDKLMFRFLTIASMCYRAGIPLACITICRIAIEAGLRERLAEAKGSSPEEVWNEIKKRHGKLRWLVKEADQEGIMTEKEFEELFVFRGQLGHNLLNKYAHADLNSIIRLFESLQFDIRVIGAKDALAEKKIQAETYTDEVAIAVLVATTKIAEKLYLL